LNDENAKPWAVFEEIPNRKFTDFKEVKKGIEQLTDKVAGSKKGIVDKAIVLSIYSKSCPDLTLIDLPGITRIPLAGSDQGNDIELVTRNMAKRYVTDPRTLILCVLPANQDITTSDGLQMARQCDPKGVRTIGVITKIDIMDRGTDARRTLLGREVPLRLGYVGVKNRAQEDIQNQISVAAAIEKEQLFFSAHPVYSTFPPGYLGIGVLVAKLTRILFTHIRHNLPAIMAEIRAKAKETQDDLKELGPPMPSGDQEKLHLLWNMATDVV
jgi:dynamin 1-like protein